MSSVPSATFVNGPPPLQTPFGFALPRRALLAGAATVLASPPRAWSAPAPHSVRDHGAKGDGRSIDTAAIQSAIASAASGGTVLFPPGEYVSGTLHLRDRLVL